MVAQEGDRRLARHNPFAPGDGDLRLKRLESSIKSLAICLPSLSMNWRKSEASFDACHEAQQVAGATAVGACHSIP
jgi:hypothetical protein